MADSPDNVAAPGSDDYDHWVDALRSMLAGSPARVLDVGTGTGFVARIAAELGHHVTAIDASQAMLDDGSTTVIPNEVVRVPLSAWGAKQTGAWVERPSSSPGNA